MTLHAWRLVRTAWVGTAFSGEGARLYGGRWNSKGKRLVYTASSAPLAVLELLVHLRVEEILTDDYSIIKVQFDESLVEEVPRNKLPKHWRSDPPPRSTRIFGNRWFEARLSVVLRVPSAVMPSDSNYLINPTHPDFARIRLGTPETFRLDPRLAKS